MFRNLTMSAVATACLLIAAQTRAGGPARLCIPIDGVTPGNADRCVQRLNSALGARVWRDNDGLELKVQPSTGQWYALMFLRQDVALSDIEAALKGTVFSVPRDRLHLFGHVTLVIQAAELPEQLTTDLAGIEHVRFEEVNQKEGDVLATVDMPYPHMSAGQDRESLAWEKFQWTDFSSDPQNKSGDPATRDTLPTIDDLREVVVRHDVQLKDLRWSATWGCRPLGAVVLTETDAGRSTVVQGK